MNWIRLVRAAFANMMRQAARDPLWAIGAVEELLVDDPAVGDEVAHPEEAPRDRARLHDDEHGDHVRQESVRLQGSPLAARTPLSRK